MIYINTLKKIFQHYLYNKLFTNSYNVVKTNLFLTLFLIYTLFSFYSCEDVIEVELNSINPKLVIEGVLNNFDNKCKIKLSKTGDYFKPNDYQLVSNAIISLSENNSVPVNFIETETGVYELTIKAKENTKYTFKVVSEGKEYTANVLIPPKIYIDSLSSIFLPVRMGREEGFVVNCHFLEQIGVINFYRLKVYKISDENKANGSFFVFDDKLVSNNNITMPYTFEVFQLSDTVVVELQSLDKSTYDFYYTLSEIAGSSGGSMGASTPANPETNISNDALGNFSAYTVYKDTIIIKP